MKRFWEKIGVAEIRNIIAIISVVGAFIMLYLLIMKPIPAENKDTLNIAVGVVLGGLIGGVNGYFFGASKNTSSNSSDK